MTDPNLRPAPPDEESEYFDGARTFPGAVETEHGVLVHDVVYEHVIDAPDNAAYVAHVRHLLGDDQDEIEHMLKSIAPKENT